MRNAALELDRALSIERGATFMSVLSLGVNMGLTKLFVFLSGFVLSRHVVTICLPERVDGSHSRLD